MKWGVSRSLSSSVIPEGGSRVLPKIDHWEDLIYKCYQQLFLPNDVYSVTSAEEHHHILKGLISDPKESLFFFTAKKRLSFFKSQSNPAQRWSRQKDDVILLRMLQRSDHVTASLKLIVLSGQNVKLELLSVQYISHPFQLLDVNIAGGYRCRLEAEVVGLNPSTNSLTVERYLSSPLEASMCLYMHTR